MDLSPVFNEMLQQKNGTEILTHRVFRVQDLEEFLKEAYRINTHVAQVRLYLRSIRQAYLSVSRSPVRKQHLHSIPSPIGQQSGEVKYMTDAQRSQVDVETKQVLQELHSAITNLAKTEQSRQDVESHVASENNKKKRLGKLGQWAAGGTIAALTPEEERRKAESNTIKVHRESVICYLQQKLEECGAFQSQIMEKRLSREMEKSKNILHKMQGTLSPHDGTGRTARDGNFNSDRGPREKIGSGNQYASILMDETEEKYIEQQLSSEQLQLFAMENHGMLKRYQDNLDNVRTAERSLREISDLQGAIAANLVTQSAHIDQLVQDSNYSTENIGAGNKELKKASGRSSVARAVFYATCAYCSLIILLDSII